MVAPVAKGVIIAASVIVAAGIAIYENPQVRQWVDQRRRKIAHALHHIGENNNRRPRSASSQHSGDPEELRRRKARNDLVRKAREEGVAVDLDELAKAGSDGPSEKTHRRGLSFDDFVHDDGTLRQTESTITEKATTTATDSADSEGLKQRGTGARGFFEGSTYANPFGDEAQVLFDRDLIGADDTSVDGSHVDDDADEDAPVPRIFNTSDPSRESSATLEGSPSPLEQSRLIDLTEPFAPPFQQAAASVPAGAASEHATEPESTASFHSFASDTSEPAAAPMASSAQPSDFISDADSDSDSDSLVHSTGTLTPTDDGFSNIGSAVGSGAEEYIAHEDARSEAAFSETGYSEISAGAHTPSSWSDVGSDVGSDYGSSNGNGHH